MSAPATLLRRAAGWARFEVATIARKVIDRLKIRHGTRLRSPSKRADRPTILFFNRSWIYPESVTPPPGYRLSTDKSDFGIAAVVVFELPELISDYSLRTHRANHDEAIRKAPASITQLTFVPSLRKPNGQLWVALSLECEAHYPQLIDREFMRGFDLTMTYHSNADVRVPYLSICCDGADPEAALRTPPLAKTELSVANLFISSSNDRSGRVAFATELMRHLSVDSYGKVLHNRSLDEDLGAASKRQTIKRYKFTLALENARAPDYVTEKLYEPLVAGSVPVYLGAPNVSDLAPAPDSFINAGDFASPRALADYLVELDEDESAYAKHLAWKTQSFATPFLALLDDARRDPFVRLGDQLARRTEP